MSGSMQDRNPRCHDCNYPLRGLHSGACPECGRPFDWNKRTTFRTNDDLNPIATQLQTRGVRLLVLVLLVAVGQLVVAGFWAGLIPLLDWTCCFTLFLYPFWLVACVVAMLAVISPSGWLGLIGCIVLGCVGAVALSLTAGLPGMVTAIPAGLVGGLFFKHLELSNML